MRQYDVCRLRPPREGLVVILQSDVTDLLDSRIVAPLSIVQHGSTIDRLRIRVDFGDGAHELQIDRLAAIERRAIGQVAGHLAHEQDRIKAALDLLFLGF